MRTTTDDGPRRTTPLPTVDGDDIGNILTAIYDTTPSSQLLYGIVVNIDALMRSSVFYSSLLLLPKPDMV